MEAIATNTVDLMRDVVYDIIRGYFSRVPDPTVSITIERYAGVGTRLCKVVVRRIVASQSWGGHSKLSWAAAMEDGQSISAYGEIEWVGERVLEAPETFILLADPCFQRHVLESFGTLYRAFLTPSSGGARTRLLPLCPSSLQRGYALFSKTENGH